MQYRELGRTGWKVSTISFGAWAIGGTWGDGHSECLLARLRRERSESFRIATKAGRRLDPHVASAYNKKNLTTFVERSLKNLEMEALDLLQLHCPPTEVFYMPEVFDALDELVKVGKLRYYGVSVEKVEEALKAIEFPNVQTVQIIFNMFRQRPLVPSGMSMAQMALRWILMSPAVTCTIPGAKRPSQIEENAKAADLPPLSDETMHQVRAIYDRLVRPHVHHSW